MKKLDHNSVENQRIKCKFVDREVLACFGYEMESVLRAGNYQGQNRDYPLPTWDDIENTYEERCPECGEAEPSPENQITEEKNYKCALCKKVFDEWDQEPQEIFEWWIITEFLYRKLKDKGHPVIEWGNNYYWGRCTTGQAILLDGVISEICAEMEILDGQKYAWKA